MNPPDLHHPLRWLVPWAALALSASLSGLFSLERRVLVPLSLLTCVSTLIVCRRLRPRFRAWTDALDLRHVLALHMLRAPIGVGFLVMESRGSLTARFAEPAGYGDILVGVLAAVLLVGFAARDRIQPSRTFLLWNTLGLVDILLVVFQAQRLLLWEDPQGMLALAGFPGALLPTFVVPLVIGSHLLVFGRALASRPPLPT